MFTCFIFRPGDRLHFYNYCNFCRFGGQPLARPLPELNLQRCSYYGLDHDYITLGSFLQDRLALASQPGPLARWLEPRARSEWRRRR